MASRAKARGVSSTRKGKAAPVARGSGSGSGKKSVTGKSAKLQEAREYLAKVRGENGDDEGPLSLEEELIDAKGIIENLKMALRRQARANLNSKKTANTAEADAMALIKKAEEKQNEVLRERESQYNSKTNELSSALKKTEKELKSLQLRKTAAASSERDEIAALKKQVQEQQKLNQAKEEARAKSKVKEKDAKKELEKLNGEQKAQMEQLRQELRELSANSAKQVKAAEAAQRREEDKGKAEAEKIAAERKALEEEKVALLAATAKEKENFEKDLISREKRAMTVDREAAKASAIKREAEVQLEKEKMQKDQEAKMAGLIRKHEQQLAQKEAVLTTIKKEKDNVNARVADKEAELDRLLKEVEQERKKFADVKREHTEKEYMWLAEKAELEEKMEKRKKQSELALEAVRSDASEEKQKALEDIKKKLKKERDSNKAQSSEVTGELTSLKADKEKLTNLINSIKADEERREKELRKEAKEALAEQSKRAQDEKIRLTRKIEDLEKILRETRDMVNKERKKADKRKQKAEDAQKEFSKIQHRMEDKEEKLKSEIHKLKKQLDPPPPVGDVAIDTKKASKEKGSSPYEDDNTHAIEAVKIRAQVGRRSEKELTNENAALTKKVRDLMSVVAAMKEVHNREMATLEQRIRSQVRGGTRSSGNSPSNSYSSGQPMSGHMVPQPLRALAPVGPVRAGASINGKLRKHSKGKKATSKTRKGDRGAGKAETKARMGRRKKAPLAAFGNALQSQHSLVVAHPVEQEEDQAVTSSEEEEENKQQENKSGAGDSGRGGGLFANFISDSRFDPSSRDARQPKNNAWTTA